MQCDDCAEWERRFLELQAAAIERIKEFTLKSTTSEQVTGGVGRQSSEGCLFKQAPDREEPSSTSDGTELAR